MGLQRKGVRMVKVTDSYLNYSPAPGSLQSKAVPTRRVLVLALLTVAFIVTLTNIREADVALRGRKPSSESTISGDNNERTSFQGNAYEEDTVSVPPQKDFVFWHIGKSTYETTDTNRIVTSEFTELMELVPPSVQVRWLTFADLSDETRQLLESSDRLREVTTPSLAMSDGAEYYEYPTLYELFAHCQQKGNENSNVYYIHSKSDDQQRSAMLVDLMSRCPRKLESVDDTCGYHFEAKPWPHYTGNFWGARCSYIISKQSPFHEGLLVEAQAANAIRPKEQKSPGGWPHDITPYGRFYAEYWVLSGVNDAPHRNAMFHYREPSVFSSIRDFFVGNEGYNALYTDGLSMYGKFQLDCCLNNLIMETIGQIERGCELAGPTDVVVFPVDLDEGGGWRTSLPLINDISIDKLKQMSLERGCILVTNKEASAANLPRIKYTDSKMSDNGPYLLWFYRSMQLPYDLHNFQKSCYPETLSGSPYTALHLRIENDWYRDEYCHKREGRKGGVKTCFTPREISSTLENKGNDMSYVLIFGEPAPQFARGTGEHPLEIPWPSTISHKETAGIDCASSLSLLSYNEKAFMDLWVAVHANRFVGHLGSTWSNGVTIARSSRRKDQNWVYSCPSLAPLVPRKDGGERKRGATDMDACLQAYGSG